MIERFPKNSPTPSESEAPVTGVRRRPRSEDQAYYALDKSGSEFIDRYHPEYLAQGGEHFVYEIPRRPNVVVKAEKRAMFNILKEDPSSFDKDV
ncbi:hypothetical protein IT087_00405, partial [Candidatus Uhrbacteria bacterium]|nr:hypothetical protein [Candidatus Uhrbacteria bacterium]